MLTPIKKYIRHLVKPDFKYRIYKVPYALKKLGTAYGGWTIPTALLDKNAICYLAGAGEDISFDTALARQIGCTAWIFDPTPRSRQHFDKVVEAASAGKPINVYENEPYDIDVATVPRLRFIPLGIWKETGIIKFFAPKDETHISHSISNLQHTDHYFEAQVETLPKIMQTNGHEQLDLLKLDIEGAEFEVLDNILKEKVKIRILCVEFHTDENGSTTRIQEALNKLTVNGYQIIARDEMDFTFLNTGL